MAHETPAQAAQQNNRDGGGKYQAKQNAEAEALEPVAQPIELDDGWDHEIEADGEVFNAISVQRNGGEYNASATPDNLDMAYLLDARNPDGSLSDEFDPVIGQSRVHAIQQFVQERYENVQFVDNGAEDHELPMEVYSSYDTAPTEEQVVNDLWETGARLANESDPGTYGSEYLGRLLSDHLDKQAFSDPYPYQLQDGTFLGEEPMSLEEAEGERDLFHATYTEVISDRAATALAHDRRHRNEDLAEFAKTGYMEREQLVRAANQGGLSALGGWARAQKTTSELLHPDE